MPSTDGCAGARRRVAPVSGVGETPGSSGRCEFRTVSRSPRILPRQTADGAAPLGAGFRHGVSIVTEGDHRRAAAVPRRVGCRGGHRRGGHRHGVGGLPGGVVAVVGAGSAVGHEDEAGAEGEPVGRSGSREELLAPDLSQAGGDEADPFTARASEGSSGRLAGPVVSEQASRPSNAWERSGKRLPFGGVMRRAAKNRLSIAQVTKGAGPSETAVRGLRSGGDERTPRGSSTLVER